jgi:ADP-ribosylglycohydrolase
MLGGDNVHRGAVLGALLGAANGEEDWPLKWREGLLRQPSLLPKMSQPPRGATS